MRIGDDRRLGMLPGPNASLGGGRPTISSALSSDRWFDSAARPGRRGGFEDLREVGPADVGHAHHPEPGLRVVVDRVDRHDVGVLEPGQDPRLVPLGPGDLQGDQPVAQQRLLGQEDPPERPPAQLGEEPIAGDPVARLREDGKGSPSVEWIREARSPRGPVPAGSPGKPPMVRRVDR